MSKISFEPMYDRVLILPISGTREIEGIVIPDTEKETHKIGYVVAVGEGYISETGEVRALRLKEHDQVLFGPYAGTPLQIDGTEFLVMREGEIAGRLKQKIIS